MLQSLFNGASGLRAQQTQMDVIGNNIANINTTGFKSSRADFQQALSDTLSGGTAGGATIGGTDPSQVGLGVGVGGVDTLQTQGSLQNTGRPLDVAIEGNGFLTLTNGSAQYYTRDGSLTIDSTGHLVSNGNVGYQIMGWNADPTTGKIDPSGALAAVQMPSSGTTVARATSAVSYAGNLDSTLTAADTVSTTYTVYDSQGAPHALQVDFKKGTAAGDWTWTATSPDGTFDAAGTGTLTFDANGKLTAGGTATPLLSAAPPSTTTLKLSLDFSSMTSLAGTGQSSAGAVSQDGLPAGSLTGYSIEPDGTVNGTFSNGMTQAIAQIALTDFTNPAGLEKAGGNVFAAAANAGTPQVGTPTSGGRGKLAAGALEMSNVDLSTEFTNMIVAQRGFQANSKIITTSDEMLQDLIALKR